MHQVICDKCKNVFTGDRAIEHINCMDLEYAFACKAWQVKRFDLCKDCQEKLKEEIRKTTANFINPEGKC